METEQIKWDEDIKWDNGDSNITHTPVESFGERLFKNLPSKAGNYIASMLTSMIAPQEAAQGVADIIQKPKIRQMVYDRVKNVVSDPEEFANWVADNPFDALGILSVPVAGTGAVTARVPGLAKVGKTISKVGQNLEPVTAGISAAEIAIGGYGKYPGLPGAAKTIAGGISGLGRETAEQAYKFGPEFQAARRGEITAGEIAKTSKGAVQDVHSAMELEFGNEMRRVTQQSPAPVLNIDRAVNKFDDILNQRRIERRTTVTGDTFLDFKRSVIAHDENAKNDLRKIDEILKLAVNDPDFYRTAEGAHTLKQQLYRHMLTFERDNKTKSIATGVWKEIRQELGDTVPGYNDMNKKFERTSDLLHEMEVAVTGNDKMSLNTTLQKLHTMMKEDIDFRRALVSEIEAKSGKDIKALVAGYMTRGYMPSSYIGKQLGYGSAFGVTSIGAATANPGVMLMGIAGTAMASPKIMSKIMHTLGATERSYQYLKKPGISYPYRQGTYMGGKITGATVHEIPEEW